MSSGWTCRKETKMCKISDTGFRLRKGKGCFLRGSHFSEETQGGSCVEEIKRHPACPFTGQLQRVREKGLSRRVWRQALWSE